MKYSAILFVILFSLFSCENKNDNLHLSIENHTNNDLENVKFYTYFGGDEGKKIYTDSLIVSKILKNQKYEINWNLSNLAKVDGAFYMVIKNDTIIRYKSFGYFSNGAILDTKYHIDILSTDIYVTR